MPPPCAAARKNHPKDQPNGCAMICGTDGSADYACPKPATCSQVPAVPNTFVCTYPDSAASNSTIVEETKPMHRKVPVAKEAAMTTTTVAVAMVKASTTTSCTDYATAQSTACAASTNWCTDTTCFGASSDLYDNCKTDPIFGAAATAVKTALEAFGCEPK